MEITNPLTPTQAAYTEAARKYLKRLPLEHFMEAIAQSTQRKITLESLDLVHAKRPEVQVFNELLVQYSREGKQRPGQVVPNNMVVVHPDPIVADGSFDLPFQPVKPYWVLEYVSKRSERKDYQDNFEHYEQHLQIPYYAIFYPENQELTLYHHNGTRYVTVPPDERGRCALPDLELEIGLLGGWMRFWFRGELLPLPADLQRELDEAKNRLKQATERAETAEKRATTAEKRAEFLAAKLRELGIDPTNLGEGTDIP